MFANFCSFLQKVGKFDIVRWLFDRVEDNNVRTVSDRGVVL